MFSPDGSRIVTGSDYGSLKVWDVATGQELLTIPKHGSGSTYNQTAKIGFTPGGARIIFRERVFDAATEGYPQPKSEEKPQTSAPSQQEP